MRRVEVTSDGLIIGRRRLERGEKLDEAEFGGHAERLVQADKLRYLAEEKGKKSDKAEE
jgi:hypothetical protein